MIKDEIINKLNLVEHIEGGYFNRTYQSPIYLNDQTKRRLLTSIYYLLTADRPIGYFHKNKSDILHFFHLGSPINYLLISPEGKLEKFTLGHDLYNGQQLQLLVKGGYWKASYLTKNEFGLISEAVSPGFDYADMQIATIDDLKHLTTIWHEINKFIKMDL